MNASTPGAQLPAVVGPADIELPPTQPIDITGLLPSSNDRARIR
jgi:hypothetical protein